MERYVDLDGSDDFVGKEALLDARTAGIRRRMVGLEVGGDPVAGNAIHLPVSNGDRRIGAVSTIVWSPRLDANLALALVESSSATPGTRVRVALGPDDEREAVTHPLPFVTSER